MSADEQGYLARVRVHPSDPSAEIVAVAEGMMVSSISAILRDPPDTPDPIRTIQLSPAVTCPPLIIEDMVGQSVAGVILTASRNALSANQNEETSIPSVAPDAVYRGKSDEQGRVVFSHIPPGSYVIGVDSDWVMIDDSEQVLVVDPDCSRRSTRRIALVLAALLKTQPDDLVVAVGARPEFVSTNSSEFLSTRMALQDRNPGLRVVAVLARDSRLHASGLETNIETASTGAELARIALQPPSRIGPPHILKAGAPAGPTRGELEVRLWDANGCELKDLALSLLPARGRGRSAAVIAFARQQVRVGSYRVRILEGPLASLGDLGEVTIGAGEDKTVDFRLSQAVRKTELHVTMPDGQSPKYAIVHMKTAKAQSTVRSMRPGRIPLMLEPGDIEFTVLVHGYEPAVVKAFVPAGPWEEVVSIDVPVVLPK